MHRSRSRPALKQFLIPAVLVSLILVSGCDLIDQLLGLSPGGDPGGGTGNAPQAVMTVGIDDDLVDMGLNPDLRPPLWYAFSSAESLTGDGLPLYHPSAGMHDVAWDYGDGGTRGFEWNDRTTEHIYREEGTYVASLSVRHTASGLTDTAQQTIVIGEAWLEIVSVTTADRPDDRVDVTVVVRNQSSQVLRVIVVDVLVDEQLWPSNLSATFSPETEPGLLEPNETYSLTSSVGKWTTGTLRVRSSFCTPWVPPQ